MTAGAGPEGALELMREVPFGHCDPAGILYTPRALDYCLEAIDAFWKRALDGRGWYEMNVDLDRGTPFVNVNIDFRSPISPRVPLRLRVAPARIGTTSVVFSVVAHQQGRLCFEASLTSVLVVRSTLRPVPPEDWLRRALGAVAAAGVD